MCHEVLWERHGVTRRFWGRVAPAEVMQTVSEVQSDPRLSGMHYLLDDCLGVRRGCFQSDTPQERHELLQQMSGTLNDEAYRAIVVDLTRADQARTWMRSLPDTRYQAGVFTSIAEAREWLDRKTASLRATELAATRPQVKPSEHARTRVLYLVDRVAPASWLAQQRRAVEEEKRARRGWVNSA